MLHKVTLKGSYSSQLDVPGDAVLPGGAEDVRQVQSEVDNAAAGCCQVGLVKEHTHEETLHDGGHSEREQEEENEERVTIVQHLPALQREIYTFRGAPQEGTIRYDKTSPKNISTVLGFCLTMMMSVSSAVLAVIMMKLSMNQVYQMTPLFTPMVLRVSLRRSSFSRTMLLTVIDTE